MAQAVHFMANWQLYPDKVDADPRRRGRLLTRRNRARDDVRRTQSAALTDFTWRWRDCAPRQYRVTRRAASSGRISNVASIISPGVAAVRQYALLHPFAPEVCDADFAGLGADMVTQHLPHSRR